MNMNDEGSPYRLAIAADFAVAGVPIVGGVRDEADWFGNKPINTGRRAEKDNAALVKAEAKRLNAYPKGIENDHRQ